MDGVQLLLVIIAAITVTGMANRRGLQAPLVVVTVGMAASFIPGLPRLQLDPAIILGIVVPPLLYSTALDLSVRSFTRNLGPILRLGVGLVVITTFIVAGVAAWVVPGLAFAGALVLGAVVAPPDAVTAVAICGRLGVPKRVMTILTGESLVNDAAALTLFGVAVSAITGTDILLRNPVLFFLYSAVLGMLVGLLVGVLVQWIRRRLNDPGLETVLGLIVPFAGYLLAQELHASGVLAVVLAGLWLGHNSAEAGFASRLQERQVWNSLDVLLEAFVFGYIGLQLRFVIDDVTSAGSGQSLGRLAIAAAVVLLVTIVIRPFWVFLAFGGRVLLARWWQRRRDVPTGAEADVQPPAVDLSEYWKRNVLVSWTGMRGVVTLAAASGIPLTAAGGKPFPARASIEFVAFVVVVATLLIQGATLPILVRALNLSNASEQATQRRERRKAESIARAASRRAVHDFLENPPDGVDPGLLQRIADRLTEAQDTRTAYLSGNDRAQRAQRAARNDLSAAISLLRQHMLSAQRTALVRERDAGAVEDETVRDLLEQLDYEEAANRSGPGSRL